ARSNHLAWNCDCCVFPYSPACSEKDGAATQKPTEGGPWVCDIFACFSAYFFSDALAALSSGRTSFRSFSFWSEVSSFTMSCLSWVLISWILSCRSFILLLYEL